MTQNFILCFILVALTISCKSSRQKDPDELVEDEFITEINGIYYFCDCHEHCGDKKMTTRGNNYYENSNIKNSWKLTNGRPDSLWVYYDSLGLKTMEILFDEGETLNKAKF